MAVVDVGETITKFYGRYHFALDDKGRAAIPAKIREIVQLRDMQTLVLRLFEKPIARFIRAYPANYFRDKILPMALQFDEESEEGIYQMQKILASCQHLRLDKQGRVNIPTEFLEGAQIQKEIRYIGMGDFFDIWNPETNDRFVAAGRNAEAEHKATGALAPRHRTPTLKLIPEPPQTTGAAPTARIGPDADQSAKSPPSPSDETVPVDNSR